MTRQELYPCNGCETRCVGCHGRGPDGAWRCTRWGTAQDALAEKHRKEAGERMGQQAAREYIWDTKRRFEQRRKNHRGPHRA